MLKRCATATGRKWQIAPKLAELAEGEIAEEIETAVTKVAQSKHGKTVVGLDYSRLLERIGNVIARALGGKIFGYFEDTRRKPFSMNKFQGIFRNARGHSAPFIQIYEYEGSENFPSEFVFLFDAETGSGLPLYPFVVRGLDNKRSYRAEADFFVFDIVRRNDAEVAYRAIQERDEVIISAQSEFPELFQNVSECLAQDPNCSLVKGVMLKAKSTDG
jgi:hypothetical protein